MAIQTIQTTQTTPLATRMAQRMKMMTRKRRRHTTRTNLADHDGDAMDGDDDDDSNDGDEDDEEGNVMSRAAIQVDAPELPPPPEPKLQPLGMSELSPFSVTLPAPKDGKDPSRLIIPLSMLVGDSAVLEMHTPISGDASCSVGHGPGAV